MASFRFFFPLSLVAVVAALECYTGFTYIRGQSVGTSKMTCKSSSDYCYNVSADLGSLSNVQGAGCSTTRCFLARNKCMQQSLLGKQVTFCCCNMGDLCNSKLTNMSTVQKGLSRIKDFLGGFTNLG